MLRSATKTVIKTKSFQNTNGVIFSPIIDLNGLILRSDRPVPELIKTFLISHGAKVNRVMIDDELFVQLTGEFNITVFEIEKFIEQNKELVDSQTKDLELVPIATKMQALFAKHHKHITESSKPAHYYTDGQSTICVKPYKLIIGEDLTFNAGRKIHLTTSGVVHANIHMQAKYIYIHGFKLSFQDNLDPPTETENATRAGFLSVLSNLKNSCIKFITGAELKNNLINTSKTLTIDSAEGHLHLIVDPTVDWVNNPFLHLPMFNAAQSGVLELTQLPAIHEETQETPEETQDPSSQPPQKKPRVAP